MTVAIRKSSPVVIRPPEPVTTSVTTKLTSLDKGFVRFPFTVLLVFEHSSHDAVESTKRALSQALVHYYDFSGRISPAGADGGGGFSIRCAGEGVEFVAASVGCALEEAKLFDAAPGARSLLDELAVYYQMGRYGGASDPLLSVQVTEFSCGGFVLGVTWNHAVADGIGIAQFLGAVGELARGLPSPSIVPVRLDDSVCSLPPLFDPIRQAMTMFPESLDMAVIIELDVTIPTSFIDRVKAEYSRSCFDGKPCTAFEVALAVLWRCRTRAIQPDPGAPAHLTLAADLRKHVGARDGYYGNCVGYPLLVMATSGAVADAGIVDLVTMIKRAKDQIPEMLKRSGSEGSNLMQGLAGRYGMLHVSCWRNIGFERVDFGTGAPARVMFHVKDHVTPPVPTCVIYPACKGKDGFNVFSASVKKEHADAFLEELGRHI